MTSMKMNKFSMLDLECSVFILELCLVLGAGYNETKVDMPNSPITTFSPPEGNTTFIDGTTWCVASPAANQLDMQQALDWACGPGLADCSGIQPGQPCYQPNNLLAVASYAFNMYYQTNGNSPIACNFGGTGMITSSDPSYGSCQFLTSGFFSTSANKGDLERFTKQLDDQYKHIYAQMGISFFDIHACMKAPISRRYPEHAVGVEEPVKEVTDLLDWASEENALAIMLHGFGGMGKTTLADAVFSLLDLEGCKYSKVQLFKSIGSTPDIVELQKQILKDLMEPQHSIPDIRTPEDGQRELGTALEEVTAFIYIDNVLGENELRQLLPKDMKKAKKLRLLLTARDINVRRGCPVKTLIYGMRSIPSAEAMSLLRKELSNGMAGNLSDTELHRIMEICGGIPLMLTLATGVIRCEEDKQKAYRIVMHDRQKMKGQTFQHTDHYLFAFDSLPDTCKDPFLDICSFFSGWDWNTVADIVGETELDILERRALVTKGKDGVACIHDVISTIGLQKTEKLRFKFTSASEVEEFFLNSLIFPSSKG